MDFDDVDSLVLYNTTCKLIANINLGMQACGDFMIGQHGCMGDQCIVKAIPLICGAKAIFTSPLFSSSPKNH